MQAVVEGFLSQSAKMDPLEKVRRWKRSLDGYISFRKAVILAMFVFAFILYVGPSIFSWLFSSSTSRRYVAPRSCLEERLLNLYKSDLTHLNGHISHSTSLPYGDSNYLMYVGNGHFGIVTESHESTLKIKLNGPQDVLSADVRFKPLVKVKQDNDFARGQVAQKSSGTVLSYVKGVSHSVECYSDGGEHRRHGADPEFSVSQKIYAHRAIPQVLVQEIKLFNPTSSDKLFNFERIGIANWDSAKSHQKRIEHGDGGKQYVVVTGTVKSNHEASSHYTIFPSASKKEQHSLAVIIAPKLDDNVVVKSGQTHTMTILTSIVYSKAMSKEKLNDINKEDLEEEAVNAIIRAVGLSTDQLRNQHEGIWNTLWTTGFGISHSMAESAINGAQINATMYYVLSQSPTPLHSLETSSERKNELQGHLAYLEGCYGSLPTLHETKNLWKSLHSLQEVNSVVHYWFLNLEVNGCHKLLKAGADGVVQAMVLSFAGLKFRQYHLELDADPKDLHRDYQMRRVSYGNATHLNISISIQADNKAILEVTLDRKEQDYFACDAGCLDPPVKLSGTEVKQFPVKLTDPVTAVLYITADYAHMQNLRHTIHVKEVMHAPAHEHHVIALHKHGNKLGGLPAIFWFSIGFLILVFHIFLFKLIWQEYCASTSQEKFRTR